MMKKKQIKGKIDKEKKGRERSIKDNVEKTWNGLNCGNEEDYKKRMEERNKKDRIEEIVKTWRQVKIWKTRIGMKRTGWKW